MVSPAMGMVFCPNCGGIHTLISPDDSLPVCPLHQQICGNCNEQGHQKQFCVDFYRISKSGIAERLDESGNLPRRMPIPNFSYPQQKHQCGHCERHFYTENELKLHITAKHRRKNGDHLSNNIPGGDNFLCPCSKKFYTLEEFDAHKQSCQVGNSPPHVHPKNQPAENFREQTQHKEASSRVLRHLEEVFKIEDRQKTEERKRRKGDKKERYDMYRRHGKVIERIDKDQYDMNADLFVDDEITQKINSDDVAQMIAKFQRDGSGSEGQVTELHRTRTLHADAHIEMVKRYAEKGESIQDELARTQKEHTTERKETADRHEREENEILKRQ